MAMIKTALQKWWFVVAVAALVVFKLWLVHTEEIYGYTTEYDCLWYLNSAKHWYWNTPYSWAAFFRPPVYPLFIALVHSFGIPLRIAIELLQMGGYLALISVLRRLQLPRWLCLSILAAFLLHPASFQLNNYVQPDNFYAAILCYAVAGLLFTLGTNSVASAIGTGAAFAILWNTREADFLLPVLFVAYLALAFFKNLKTRSWRQAAKILLAPSLSILATSTVLTLAVYTANYRVFGGFAKSEMTAPSFKAAYRALLRIKPGRTQRFVPVAHESFELAYSVSPAFAQLKEPFDGQLGRDWQAETVSTHGITGEIGSGWLRFALRSVAASVGAYKDSGTANDFFRRVAQEINQACDENRMPSRFVFSSFLDPGAIESLRFLPASFRRIAPLFVLPYQMSPDRQDAILRPGQRALYDEMTSRRVQLTSLGTLRIVGWAFRFGDPLALVAYDGGGGEIESAISSFGPRPDIVESFKSQGDAPLRNEFGLPLVLRRKGDPAGSLLFVTQSGRRFVGPASSILAGAAPTENGAPGGEPLVCHIFAQELTPAVTSSAPWMENVMAKYYRIFLFALILAGVVAVSVLAFRARRLHLNDDCNALIILLAVIIASRVLLFAYIDATSWPANDARYLFPAMPLFSLLLIVLIYQAARVLGSDSVARSTATQIDS
jgi:hypothetical protein